MARKKLMYPSWVLRDKKLIAHCKRRKFRSQKKLEEFLRPIAEDRGIETPSFFSPWRRSRRGDDVRDALYGGTRDRRLTPKAKWLNLANESDYINVGPRSSTYTGGSHGP